jgi:type I restriction enzyme S subunit
MLNMPFGKKQVREITSEVTRPKITLTEFRKILIPLPEKEEQIRSLKRLEAMVCAYMEMERSLTKLRALKTALMQDLLTGRKRVTALLHETEVPA